VQTLFAIATIIFCACNNSTKTEDSITDNLDSLHFTVEAAPEWDALLNASMAGLVEMVFIQFH
jgi:hypothetical protein